MTPRHVGHIWQLDALRGVAASYVVLYHSNWFRHTKVGAVFSVGPEAVILFFVLSGFVISYATENRREPLPFKDYFVRRFLRIFPLFLMALAAAYAGQCVAAGTRVPIESGRLLGNILMLQDVALLKAGTWVDTYKENHALWSLSYEWWFYMLFALALVAMRGRRTGQRYVVFVLSLSAAVSYQIVPTFAALVLAYWFIWWCGVELSREFQEHGTVTFRRQWLGVAGTSAIAAVWAGATAVHLARHRPLVLGFEPVLELRHFAAAVVVLLATLAYAARPVAVLNYVLRPFLPIGQLSYALYILHQPVLHLPGGSTARLVGLIALLPACYLSECVAQPWINRLARPSARPGLPAGTATPAT